MQARVVRRVGRQHLGRGRADVLGILVQERGVDAERHTRVKAVIDDRGDARALVHAPLRIDRRLFFDQRGDRDDLLQTHAAVLRLLEQIRRQDIMEALQELVDRARRLHAHVELVGVREEVSLQTGHVARLQPLEEGVVVLVVLGGVHQRVEAADLLLLQALEDLIHREALGESHLDGLRRAGARAHILDQRTIVVGGFQLVAARRQLGIRVGDLAEGLEEPAILDQSGLLERRGDVFDVRRRDALRADLLAVFVKGIHGLRLKGGGRERDHRGKVVLIERQRIAGGHPGKAGQHDAHADDEHRVHDPAEAAGLVFPPSADGAVVALAGRVAGLVGGPILLLPVLEEELVHGLGILFSLAFQASPDGHGLFGGFLRHGFLCPGLR